MIVVDASVLANALADDEADGDAARGELRAADQVTAPDLVDVETVSVLRKRWLGRTLSDQRFEVDASYVALAERLDCELVTADGRLATAPGPRCAIRVLR